MTVKELRVEFWRTVPVAWRVYRGRKQNRCPVDVRVAWCDFVDAAARDGRISEAVAQSATL